MATLTEATPQPDSTSTLEATSTSFTGAFNEQQRAAVAASAGQALTLANTLRDGVETKGLKPKRGSVSSIDSIHVVCSEMIEDFEVYSLSCRWIEIWRYCFYMFFDKYRL